MLFAVRLLKSLGNIGDIAQNILYPSRSEKTLKFVSRISILVKAMSEVKLLEKILKQLRESSYRFPKSRDWDMIPYDQGEIKLPALTATTEPRKLLERKESGWLVWLFMRCNRNQVRLRLRLETPAGMITPWSYTPAELQADALSKWLPRYDTTNDIYVVDVQFNPWWLYNVTLRLEVLNEGSDEATISKIKLLRIRIGKIDTLEFTESQSKGA